jgi:hypothetical protein
VGNGELHELLNRLTPWLKRIAGVEKMSMTRVRV